MWWSLVVYPGSCGSAAAPISQRALGVLASLKRPKFVAASFRVGATNPDERAGSSCRSAWRGGHEFAWAADAGRSGEAGICRQQDPSEVLGQS